MLTCIYEILRKIDHQFVKSLRLAAVTPAPLRLIFRISKILKDLLARSKLNVQSSIETGVDKWCAVSQRSNM